MRGGVDEEIVGVVVDALRCEMMGHGAGAVLWAGSPAGSLEGSAARG